MSKKALINIDYTNDFVDGALPVGKPGEAIEEKVISLTKEFLANGDYVVLAIDIHVENDPFHPETKLFPPHNLDRTQGRELYGGLAEVYRENMDSKQLLYMDKTRYSAFSGTNLDIWLRERGVTELHLIGVCTDICVLHTAVDAYNKGYKITVHQDAVASFNQVGHDWALGHFAGSLGATIL